MQDNGVYVITNTVSIVCVYHTTMYRVVWLKEFVKKRKRNLSADNADYADFFNMAWCWPMLLKSPPKFFRPIV